jgi:hypothetical protein
MVAGFILAFSYMNYSLTTTSTAIVSNYSTVIERTAAQNATNSAIHYFLKKLAYDKKMARPKPYLLDVKLDQTTTTTSVQILKVSTSTPDTFVLCVQSAWGLPRTAKDGTAYKDTLKSYVTVTSSELAFPPITAAIRIFDQTASFNFSGSPTKVHGEDADTSGYTILGGQNIPAFMVSTTADSTRLKTALTKTGVISGAGNPSYVTEKPTQQFDINQYVSQISALAGQTLTTTTIKASTDLGTLSNPKITVLAPPPPANQSQNASVSISGNVTGAGILIVKADLKGSGNFTFKGLVIIIGSQQITFSSTGNTKIYGALLMSGNTAAYSSKGSGDIFYSSQALKIVKDKLSNGRILNIAWWE